MTKLLARGLLVNNTRLRAAKILILGIRYNGGNTNGLQRVASARNMEQRRSNNAKLPMGNVPILELLSTSTLFSATFELHSRL